MNAFRMTTLEKATALADQADNAPRVEVDDRGQTEGEHAARASRACCYDCGGSSVGGSSRTTAADMGASALVDGATSLT